MVDAARVMSERRIRHLPVVEGENILVVGNLSRLGRFTGRKLGALLVSPTVAVRNSELEPEAAELGQQLDLRGGGNRQPLLLAIRLKCGPAIGVPIASLITNRRAL